MYRRFWKRFLDVAVSMFGLLILGIPMLLVALFVKLDSKGPVLFKQTRLGLHGNTFEMYKFRSMCVGAEKMGSGVYSEKGDARVTRIGRILRATSIDELPQMLNILKGDMSIVGPRPPLTYHPWPIEQYTEEQMQMFAVRPGITGWAQVNGRKNVEWNERIRMNVWYVENVSFALDMKVLFMTVGKVFTNADNVSVGTTVGSHETAEK